tara:strand:+ start:1289 stop:1903 length:615 start_codon:yes stop_codon:yes gene_type:complete
MMLKKKFFATISVLLFSYLNVYGQDFNKSISKAIQKTLNEMPDCEYILFSDRHYELNLQNIITEKTACLDRIGFNYEKNIVTALQSRKRTESRIKYYNRITSELEIQDCFLKQNNSEYSDSIFIELVNSISLNKKEQEYLTMINEFCSSLYLRTINVEYLISIDKKKKKTFEEILKISGKIILGIIIFLIGVYFENLIGIDLFY